MALSSFPIASNSPTAASRFDGSGSAWRSIDSSNGRSAYILTSAADTRTPYACSAARRCADAEAAGAGACAVAAGVERAGDATVEGDCDGTGGFAEGG